MRPCACHFILNIPQYDPRDPARDLGRLTKAELLRLGQWLRGEVRGTIPSGDRAQLEAAREE